MKNLLLIIAAASFALAGATQKEQPKKTSTAKTTAAKKSPTPKKSTPTAKKPAAKKEPEKKAALTAKKTSAPAKNTSNRNTSSTAAKNNSNKKDHPKPKTTSASNKTKTNEPAAKPKPKPPAAKKDDKGDLEKALALEGPDKKIAALKKFLTDYPRSGLRLRAHESLTAARAASGDAKLEAGDRESGLKMIRTAIEEAPTPYTDKLFVEVISRIPASLLARGEGAAAFEIASAIEKNASSSAPHLLTLANFYLSTENGGEAKRLAEAAIKLDEKSAGGYWTLGMANRLNFDLESSAAAFAKASELDPESATAARNLADMKRALGRSEEALAIYATLLAKDPNDLQSQTGRVLALFDSGKRNEAELELSRSIEAVPGNVMLLASAAYWYAAAGENTKAIDLAGKAIAAEPRYIWSHIALARAYSTEGRFADAEQTLLNAKKYGNFATLEYEIASIRFANGFYREASDELRKSFYIKDGAVATKLGRRIERSEKSLPDLVAYERRASILLPRGADNAEDADRLKTLLEFRSVLSEGTPDQTRAAELADAFSRGTDKMRFHRQIYAANELLENRVAAVKALELSRAAISAVDEGLSVANAAAPIMANELYASRTAAMALERYVVVPNVPKQTLSALARGRIEEIAGWSLMQQGNNAEAVTRLRRAASILPEKSAWWRSSMWRLGAALEADGKDKDSLDAYVKSYASAEPDAGKYAAIETVYKRVNGGTDGLEALIGAKPSKASDKVAETPAPIPVEQKKETTAAPIEEKPVPKTETPPTVSNVGEKQTEVKKEPDKPVESPSPTPIETVKKSEPAPVEEKPIVKTEAPRVSNVEEKAAKQKKTPEPTPSPVETPKKTEPEPVQEKPKDSSQPPSEKDPEKDTKSKKRAENEPKPLFEPVIIEVKSSAPVKSSGEEKNVADRPRVVDGKPTVGEAPPPCEVIVSQESISLVARRGTIGLLVGIVGEGDIKQLKATTSSSKDILVTKQPEIAGVSGRTFYVIKSLSSKPGTYDVTFAAPCGKKQVSVKVR